MQIMAFIDATSIPLTATLVSGDTALGTTALRYYVNTFSDNVTSDSERFYTNSFRRAADEVEANIMYAGGGTDIAAGIDDLTDEFVFGEREDRRAGLAIVITDGRSSRAEAKAAADQLRAQGVTVAAIGIGNGVDRATLEAVASVGGDGVELVFTTGSFDEIARLLAAVLRRIGATLLRS